MVLERLHDTFQLHGLCFFQTTAGVVMETTVMQPSNNIEKHENIQNSYMLSQRMILLHACERITKGAAGLLFLHVIVCC